MPSKETRELTPIGMGVDQHAVLYKADGKILRAIKPKSSAFYSQVIDAPVVNSLINEQLLIASSRSDVFIEGHDLVIEHPLLDRVSYPFEWTPNMFRDAAITLLKFNIGLMEAGYCTHDAHLWNVLFDGITPKFIDFTSIIKVLPGGRWRAYQQFKNYCLYPMLMMQAGYPTPARQMMREIFSYPDPEFVGKVIHSNIGQESFLKKGLMRAKVSSRNMVDRLPPEFKETLKSCVRLTRESVPDWAKTSEGDLNDVKALLKMVESLNLTPKHAQWSQYYGGKNELPVYDGNPDVLNAIRRSTPKHELISNILEKIRPGSVLDLGCNRGLYSQMASMQGAKVVGVDLDERALDDMYLDSKRLGTTAIPLYVNAVAPAEALGFAERPFPLVNQRLRSELILCLALVHHLVFKGTNMSFEHIAKLFDSYSEKYLLVEFIPIEDAHIKSWYTDYYDWYNMDNFIKSLKLYFQKVEVHESFPSPRKLLFCEK